MAARTAVSSRPSLRRDRAFLALAALLLLLSVAGDVLTTRAALTVGLGGAGGSARVELNPVVALVLAHWSWSGLVLWKLAVALAWLAVAAVVRARGRFARRVALSATALYCALVAFACLVNLSAVLAPS